MPTKYMYSKIISNRYLGVTKEIKAQTDWELDIKAKEQLSKWRQQEYKKKEQEKNEDLKVQALYKTQKSLDEIDRYKNILLDSLGIKHSINLDILKRSYDFKEFEFNEAVPNIDLIKTEINVPPKRTLMECFFKSLRNKRIKLEDDAENLLKIRNIEYLKNKETAKKEYEDKKQKFIRNVKANNDLIDEFKIDIELGEESAVEKYADLVLKRSKYPSSIEKEYELQYDSKSSILIISYELPKKEEIPNIIEHRYIAKRKEVDKIKMKDKEFNQYYEIILYNICLRNIYEVYDSLKIDSLKSVVFNGWISGVDPKTGNDFHSCIMSLQASREEFSNLNLSRVDPKECFRNLKGISAGPLSEIAPIKPILDLNRNDSRFVASREVLDKLDDGTNLAEMNWEDFEHLVRELFAKIFNRENCEVNVTRASRDSGVDAIAFDPDPIRGGKFVIQAKRYNDIVPPSAVRDLLGTITNERANKGILVTTSDYGSESIELAKINNITLINGAQLLYMFKEHGYNLNIRLKNKKYSKLKLK